jgi:cell division protein FtsW
MKNFFSGTNVFRLMMIILAMTGCLTILNATLSSEFPAKFAARQIVWFFIGVTTMLLTSKLDFEKIKKTAPAAIIISYLLLLAVLVVGTRVNGMKGWFNLGFFFLQPSELAKPFFVLSICLLCAKENSNRKIFINLLALCAGWMIPIIMEPDYGTSILYFSVIGLAFFLLSKKIGHFFAWTLPGMALILIILLREAYVVNRIQAYFSPFDDPYGAGWHILQFRYAIARGGLWGSGWGNCLWAGSYLPLSHSDSAFATLTEASGMLGSMPVALVFAAIPFAAGRIISGKDEFRTLFILLASSMVAGQAFIHIFVNLGMIPPTGLPLPLFSYGGSSLLSTMLTAGFILSAAKIRQFQEENKQ